MNGPRSYIFNSDGGSQSFSFSCNKDWSISSSEPWISVSPTSGTSKDGDVTVTITCAANSTYDSRTATVTLKVEDLLETVSITQEEGGGLIVSPKSLELNSESQIVEIDVQKNVQYSVTIDDAGKEWITYMGVKALSSEKATFLIAANETFDAREGKITFKQKDGSLSETVSIIQEERRGFIVSPKSLDLNNEAQTIEIDVQKNVQYSVTVDDAGKEWISYTGTKALSSEKATFSIAANESFDAREGKIIFKQSDGSFTETVVVRQNQKDGLFLTVTEYEVSNQSQNLEIPVNTNVELTVNPGVKWIKHVETKSLSNKKIVLAIDANPSYAPREGTVDIKKSGDNLNLLVTVTIKQEAGEGLIVSPKSFDVDVNSQTIEVKIQHNIEWVASISEDAKSWITPVETKALQTSTAVFQISKNEGDARTGIITFSGKGLVQEVVINQAAWVHVSSITLNPTSLELAEGSKKTIRATVLPKNASDKTIIWTSSNENIATVADGVVTAIYPGTVTITATCDGVSADCSVVVLSEYDLDLENKVSVTLVGSGLIVSTRTYYTRTYRIRNNSIVDIDVYEIGTSNFISLETKIAAGSYYDTTLYLSYNVYPEVTVRFRYNGHNYEIYGGQ